MELQDFVSVEDFQRLHIMLGWKILDSNMVEKSLKNSMFVVSAIENGKVIGMARIVGDEYTHGLLCDVMVLPLYQGQGIGKAMVLQLLGRLQSYVNENCDEFLLELLPTKGNEEFYIKCGFKHKPENMEGCYLWLKNQKIYQKDSKKYIMHLKKSPFDSIKSGQKTIEMRLNDEKRRVLKKGDIILFFNDENYAEMIKTKIVALHPYKNFEELYFHFDKTKLGYKENENPLPSDMSKYYSKENIEKYGVLGIEIKVIE